MIKKYLSDLDALAITTGHFLLLSIPALLVLTFSGFFSTFEGTPITTSSLGYVAVLAIFGTGIAKVLFNKLIHISSPVFSSSVTYVIPVVAVMWGVIDGEKLSFIQFFAGGIILLGVWLVNKAK